MKYRLLLSCLALSSLPLTSRAADMPKDATPGSTLTVGAGLGFGPRFPGSKKNHVGLLPMFEYQNDSGFFASTQRGLGWGGETDGFKYSLSLAARGERTEKKPQLLSLGGGGEELKGMGKVKATALGLFAVGARLGERAEVNAAVELPLTQRNNGRALHLGASVVLLQQARDTLALGGTVSYGDSKYLQTYYGVTAAQAQGSGYTPFSPKKGFYEADLNLMWNHRLDAHWALVGIAGANHLMGDAGKSPLARRKTAPTSGLLVTYTY